MRKALWKFAVLVLPTFLFLVFVFLEDGSAKANEAISLAKPAIGTTEPGSVSECVRNFLPLRDGTQLDLPEISETAGVCYQIKIAEENQRIFALNEELYREQISQGQKLLWMVIAITISGVILAAAQRYMSYDIAAKNKASFSDNSEITVELNKMSVRSSYVGLGILSVSFAFFLIHVLYVYTISQPRAESAAVKKDEIAGNPAILTTTKQYGGAQTPNLPPGQLTIGTIEASNNRPKTTTH